VNRLAGREAAQKPIRILHVEDSEPDSRLLRTLLEGEGLSCRVRRIETRERFVEELKTGGYDLIVSDFRLPSFDGAQALALAREYRPEIPFIYLSGAIGEEAAVEALLKGATDYVLKDNMKRLIPAVTRALREAERAAEHAHLHEQFLQAQKMEAVGRLAGGVAHDFNNVLTVILGYCDILLRRVKEPEVKEDLHEIKAAGERASSLLTFSRRQLLQPRVLNLNDVVAGTQKMLRRIIGEDVELRVNLAEKLPLVKVDVGQMEQVVMNLAVNARDAMPGGGRLTIETAKADFRKASPPFDGPPGEYVRLSVSDTGAGMNAETKAHLFEPFFTTKEKGKGTGLGLATVFGIVKQSGGDIQVESEVGRGSAFHIYLPSSVEAPMKTPAASSPRRELGGAETVLVVEDEEAVRSLILRVLKAHGYRALEAKSPTAAQELAKNLKTSIDLLVTDVILPEMNGQALAEALTSLRPGLRTMFISGYSDDMAVRFGVLESGRHFLQKPFTPEQFLRTLRETLDA
jgi:two-component system, cell cycle sensor histidine kinase and response regulator CckA